ncbi:hypothetical protein N8I77_011960 [Diaporthe amygdali]|uniref:Uncharacterized protein n=1 Tax=Phomopsis amygdali TaxID=1214568 RepID=A0AAD9VXQ2_PHOAM|nr:hypothetical protein N8I77_011960 [Diaporthe amygdali]
MIMQTSKSFTVLLLSSLAAALPQEQVNDPQVTLTTITVGLPTSCSFKPTQTITATTGCETPCSTYADNCWWDNGLGHNDHYTHYLPDAYADASIGYCYIVALNDP